MTKSVMRNRALWVAAFVAVMTFLVTWRLWFPGRPFDSAVWQSITDPNDITRRDMADRLIARRSLIGKSKDNIIEMFGPAFSGQESRLTYLLGPQRGFIGIDSEWLVLILGADGRVVRAFTEHD